MYATALDRLINPQHSSIALAPVIVTPGKPTDAILGTLTQEWTVSAYD
jgi:hypothetical protein